MAISSSAPEKVATKVATEKMPIVAIIYDSTIEPKNKRLGNRSGFSNKKPIIRPSITLMGKPRAAGEAVEGMAKYCPLLVLNAGATILSDRALWEEVKSQSGVARLLDNGQLFEIEATSDEGANFSSFNTEDVELLLANLYHEDFINPYLDSEKRKEVFRMADERKAECVREMESRK